MAPSCPTPGCPGTSFDSTGAETICMVCGSVVASSCLVSEVEFQEGAGGSSSALGQFVGMDGGGGRLRGFVGGSVFSRASREVTIAAARQMINLMANALKISEHVRNVAVNFYSMALSRNLTMGKRRPVTVSVCLYMACRTENSSHLIVDFADLIKVPLADLGASFLSMAKKLCIRMPSPDPSLYLFRFVHSLGYGDKAHEIGTTAGRVLSRMKSDWIDVGRKPSGLCAAAIFIAGKLHKDERTYEELLKVIKIHHSTLRKRLKEFGETSASSLTVEEFLGPALDKLPSESEPPILKAQRAAELLKEDQELAALLQGEDDEEEDDLVGRVGGRATFDKVYREISKLLNASTPKNQLTGTGFWHDFVKDVEATCAAETDDILKFLLEEDAAGIKDVVEEEEAVVGGASDVKPDVKFAPLPDFLQLKTDKNQPKRNFDHFPQYVPSPEDPNGELDLDGIDDAELDCYLLTAEESKMKAMLWFKLNGSYIKEQQVKKMFEDLDKGKEKRSYKRKTPTGGRRPNTFAEMAKRKKLSNLINFDILKELQLNDDPSKEDGDKEGKKEEEGTAEKPDVKPTTPKASRSSFNEYRARFAKKNPSFMPKTVKAAVEKKEEKKTSVEEEVKIEPKPEPQYHVEEDDEEEEEDEEENVGARALLAQFSGGGETADDAYDYDDY